MCGFTIGTVAVSALRYVHKVNAHRRLSCRRVGYAGASNPCGIVLERNTGPFASFLNLTSNYANLFEPATGCGTF